MRNKKGMSPLIATVLLIAFAVALGAMIMNWSTDIEESESPGKTPTTVNPCGAISIELNEVFGKKLFCYQNNTIKFNIVNTGSREITGIQLRTVDNSLQIVAKDVPSSRIAVGGTFDHTFAYDKSGKVHVELVPYVVEDSEPYYCVKQQIVQDVLPACDNE